MLRSSREKIQEINKNWRKVNKNKINNMLSAPPSIWARV